MEIKEELGKIIPAKRIKTRLIDVLSYAADAGFYSLTPKAVVQPVNESEIIALFNFSHVYQIPLVFGPRGQACQGSR